MRFNYREQWHPKYGRGHETDGAKTIVVVHHDSNAFPSRSEPGMSIEQEAGIMRLIEEFHASKLTKADPRMAYQFAGMQSGRVWEGIGWGHIGAHTAGMNSAAVGFFVPINGDADAPTPALVAAFHDWRAEGVRLGRLAKNHVVKGHSDYGKPSCPGEKLYDSLVRGIKSPWPRFTELAAAHPTLKLGKGGKNRPISELVAVTYLQDKLVSAGLLKAPVVAGYFGGETELAVRELQFRAKLRRQKMGGTVIVGPATWKVVDAI